MRLVALFIICLLTPGCTRRDAQEVVVYVSVDRAQAEPILTAWQRQTGIQVRALYDAEAAKTTGLVSRLMAEAQRPRCDVFWNNELVQTLHLSQRGLLQPYVPESARDIPSEFKDREGMWTGIATRARVIVYNTQYIKQDDAPRSLWDLTQPRWKGKVAVANPQFGTTRTHVAALFAVLGPEKAQELLRGLLANEVRIVDGNATVKNLVARAAPNASPIYVGLTDTDDVLSGQAEGEPVGMIYPDQATIGTLVIPVTVCVVRGAPHREAAEQLIEYLVSPKAVEQLTIEGSGYRDIRRPHDAGMPKSFPIAPEALLEQLGPSSRWTQEYFHK